jgi:hypothetical protein
MALDRDKKQQLINGRRVDLAEELSEYSTICGVIMVVSVIVVCDV